MCASGDWFAQVGDPFARHIDHGARQQEEDIVDSNQLGETCYTLQANVSMGI
jgi:hypothetical protein